MQNSISTIAAVTAAHKESEQKEAKLITVIESDAPRKEKHDACRELARKGTKKSIAPLAAMLGVKKF